MKWLTFVKFEEDSNLFDRSDIPSLGDSVRLFWTGVVQEPSTSSKLDRRLPFILSFC